MKCENCGAPLDYLGKCEYCGTQNRIHITELLDVICKGDVLVGGYIKVDVKDIIYEQFRDSEGNIKPPIIEHKRTVTIYEE